MPNLFSTAYQKICETFSGPRTIDTEFNAKVEEMKVLERSLLQIKSIFPNFPRNTQGKKFVK
jgi:ribonucleotide reductase beta subunit family protein with ferritin-like domain